MKEGDGGGLRNGRSSPAPRPGFDAYLVGGCVRDLLLKRAPKDFDVITTASLQQIKRRVFKRCIIIGRRFPICQINMHGSIIEVSSFRTNDNYVKGSEEVDCSDDLNGYDEGDILRWKNSMKRDFTINSLFFNPSIHRIYDYVNGVRDVRNNKTRLMMEMKYMLSHGAAESSVRLLRKYGLLDILLPFQAAYLSDQIKGKSSDRDLMLMPKSHQSTPEATENWSEEKKASSDGSTKISQNTKKVTVVELSRNRDELTQHVNWVRNVRSSDPKIDKAPYKMAIACGVLKRRTISRPKMNTKLHRNICHALISKTNTSKDILNVLLLGEVVAIRRRSDLNPKEVTKKTQIRHQELLTEMLLHKGDVLRVISSDDHIIHIEERPTPRRGVNKEGRVVITGGEAGSSDNKGETVEPSTRGLFEPIERAIKTINHTIRDRIPKGWLYVNLLTQLTIEKGTLDVQLRYGPLSNRDHSKESASSGHRYLYEHEHQDKSTGEEAKSQANATPQTSAGRSHPQWHRVAEENASGAQLRRATQTGRAPGPSPVQHWRSPEPSNLHHQEELSELATEGEVHNLLPEVRPVEPNRSEWDGEGAVGGSHLEHRGGADVEVRGWRGRIGSQDGRTDQAVAGGGQGAVGAGWVAVAGVAAAWAKRCSGRESQQTGPAVIGEETQQLGAEATKIKWERPDPSGGGQTGQVPSGAKQGSDALGESADGQPGSGSKGHGASDRASRSRVSGGETE
uniref:PH01B031C15.24 protein n=1 Tax=Phyllostachys edulis TaxID=38705 RepID=L0P1U5_PHYED|nr:PH01B031C15.24 [Phyllostachys edulis]